MAKQQFYSRVPARFSMFNKADGFDTFACSEGLDREFIEKELAVICDTKPTADESVAIRKGELPPVYAQFCTKRGDLVQSCISYIATDFTGERSAYMVHNLVMSDVEKAQHFENPDYDVFNPTMFQTDLSGFSLLDPKAKPIQNYPELYYIQEEAEPLKWLTETYDPMMLKRFLFTALSTACGKYKSIFFLLPGYEDPQVVLRFLNSILQVIPYHIRPVLSFVTRVAETSRYPAFKLKCVLPGSGDIPITRGVTLNLGTKLVVGVNDEDIVACGQTVEFFYSLLLSDGLRREFLGFADKAVKAQASLGALTMKAIGDLVFLFRCGCGMYDEKVVLPNDDKILEFLTVYEKNRNAMSTEYRITAMKCLTRYVENHQVIPPKIFAKMTKLYPSEVLGVRHVIMNLALDLIHTDLMREKLFTFIKNNYEIEDGETENRMVRDLCQVFYGGFLQSQIIALFREYFQMEPDWSQDMIVEKFLLAIRTKSIQQPILDFLMDKYSLLSQNAKEQLYDCILEHLPEGDSLSIKLISFANDCLPREDVDHQVSFAERLCEEVEREQRRREHPMLQQIAAKGGFCSDAVLTKILQEWVNRKILPEYIDYVCSGDITNVTGFISAAWRLVPDMREDVQKRLLETLQTSLTEKPPKAGLYQLLEAESVLMASIEALKNKNAKNFADDFSAICLRGMICDRIWDVFRPESGARSVQLFAKYGREHPAIAADSRYLVVEYYIGMKKAAERNQAEIFIALAEKFPKEVELRKNISRYMNTDLQGSGMDKDAQTHYLIPAVSNYIGDGYFRLNKVYEQALTDHENHREKAITAVLYVGNMLYGSRSEEIRAALMEEKSGLGQAISQYLSSDGKPAKINGILTNLQPVDGYAELCKTLMKANLPEKKGFFAALFGRK